MKKEYKKPELKEIKLKNRSNLLQSSDPVTGELGYNAHATEDAQV